MTTDGSLEGGKNHLSKTIAVGFMVAIVFTALAHGTVEPWSVFVFEAMVIVLLLLWSVKIISDKRLELNIPNTAWPIAAFALVALFQSIAFTDGTGRWLSLSKNVGSTRAAATV